MIFQIYQLDNSVLGGLFMPNVRNSQSNENLLDKNECEFCSRFYPIGSSPALLSFGKKSIGEIYIAAGGNLILTSNETLELAEINYCPICGNDFESRN